MNYQLLFKVFIFTSFFSHVMANTHRHTSTIEPYARTHYGSWGVAKFRPYLEYVQGVDLKIEGKIDGDDTAMNTIQLVCSGGSGSSYDIISSSTGEWGSWRGIHYCPPGGYMERVKIRTESAQGNGDDTDSLVQIVDGFTQGMVTGVHGAAQADVLVDQPCMDYKQMWK